MKIGFVLDDTLDKPDGVQQYILTLSHWLRVAGHEIHYLVGETHRTDLPHIHSLSRNKQVTFNGNRVSIPRRVKKNSITRILQKEKFDVLHIQAPFSPMLGGQVIKRALPGTAIVSTFHIVPFSKLEQFATRALRLVIRGRLKKIDQTISVSIPAQRFAKKSLGLKSVVIPNAIPIVSFQSGKELRKYQDGKINIVFLGRLVERKGCLLLLQALNQLHLKHMLNNVRVLICGRGPLEDSLKDYVRRHSLGNIVHFAGFISELSKADYLASAHIAVFPSIGGESFGIVLVEAMAAGADVVLGGNNAGYRSILGSRPEQLFRPHNTKEFTKKLQHYIMNARARQQAKIWQSKQLEQYDIRTIGPQIQHIYEAAILKHASKKA